MNKITLLFIAIIMLGLILRALPLLKGISFFEPDNLIYYSIMKQTIVNNYTIPKLDGLSGISQKLPYTEQPGLIYLAIIPYILLNSIISLHQVMYLVQILFSIAGMIIVYKLAEMLTDNKTSALLAMFFYATLPAAIFKSSLAEWRGDSFVPIILGASIVFLLYGIKLDMWYKKDIFWSLSLGLIVLAWWTWNGATYAIVTFVFIILLLILTLFIKDIRKIIAIGITCLIILWIIYLNAGILNSVSIINTNITFNSTISEVQPTTPLFLFANFLMAFFLMFFSLIGFHLNERTTFNKMTYLAILGILLIAMPLMLSQVRYVNLATLAISIFAGMSFQIMNELKEKYNLSEKKIMRVFIITIAISLIVPIYQFIVLQVSAQVSPQYHQVMLWIENNTTPNSTFLTMWQDGSAIEGWANRSSFTDSVVGQRFAHITNFSRFLFAKQGNFTYLKETKPNYILTRSYWKDFIYTIEREGYLPLNNNTNNTNYQFLVYGTSNSITYNEITLEMIYNKSGTNIFKVIYLNNS